MRHLTSGELFVILILGIWLLATIGAAITKQTEPYGAAMVITFCIGFGYLVTHH
jgi:hypothetical protein